MEKKKVLFLCTGNSARSQMAEAILRKFGGKIFEVYSAGLEPKDINPYTLKVLFEEKIDTSNLYSKPLAKYIGKVNFDFLITVCSNADERCPFFPGMGERLYWPFEDPAVFDGDDEEKLKKFRDLRDQIKVQILNWLQELNFTFNI